VSEEDEDRFADALRGKSDDPALAQRLGELLRTRQKEAASSVDELTRRRVWQQIDHRIAVANPASGNWLRRTAFAQAAVFAIIGIALGYFLGTSTSGVPSPGQLEFSYGDLEASRGALTDVIVAVDEPVEGLRPLTEALIRDQIAFEVHSVTDSPDRRLLVTYPATIPAASAEALRELGITPTPGATQSIRFTSSR